MTVEMRESDRKTTKGTQQYKKKGTKNAITERNTEKKNKKQRCSVTAREHIERVLRIHLYSKASESIRFWLIIRVTHVHVQLEK